MIGERHWRRQGYSQGLSGLSALGPISGYLKVGKPIICAWSGSIFRDRLSISIDRQDFALGCEMRQHCPKCGSFTTPRPENADLFLSRGGLPIPPAGDAFSAFHQQSQAREEAARRKGICRTVGQERQARRAFTIKALGGVT